MKTKLLTLITLLAIAQPAFSSESSDENALLRAQIELLTKRLDKLENQASETKKKKVIKVIKETKQKKKKPSLADRISFKADFRDRYEIIDQEGKHGRERNRVRLRAALSMKVNDKTSFTIGTATGGDDPVSTNQTLGDAYSTKDVRLDLAYMDYKFSQSTKLTAGKMKNPLYKPGKNPAFWDGDLNPEGIALSFDTGFLTGSLVGFSVDERKESSEALMLGGQAMHKFKMSGSSSLTAGLGYYDYAKLEGQEALYDGKPRGNTVDENGNYVNDYNIIEALVEFKSKLNDKPFSIYANLFQNSAADQLDSAYIVGVKYGKVSGPGTWDLGLSYQDTEADAVVGLFNDSDFAGGNTDSKGFTLKAGYGIVKDISFGLTYINSEFGQSLASQTDYKRLQLDLKLKFK